MYIGAHLDNRPGEHCVTLRTGEHARERRRAHGARNLYGDDPCHEAARRNITAGRVEVTVTGEFGAAVEAGRQPVGGSGRAAGGHQV